MNTKRLCGWKKSARIFMAMLALLVSGQAFAQSTWYGSASTSWNNPTNWTPGYQITSGNIQSVPASGANITIPSGDAYYPIVTSSLTIGTLTMNQGSGSFTITAGTLATSGINISGGGNFTNSSGTTVISSGTITSGGTWLDGGSVTGTIALTSSSVFTINPGATVNTSSGGININSGGGFLNIYGTLNDGANAIIDDITVTIAGGSLIGGAISVPGGGSLTITNSTVTGGALTVSGGTMTVNSGTTLTVGNIIASSGSLTISNATLNSGTITVNNGNMAVYGGTAGSGAITVSSGSLTLNSGTGLTAGAISVTGGSMTVNSGVSVTAAGAGDMTGGSFTVNSGATVAFTGGMTSFQGSFTTLPGSAVSIGGPFAANSGCNISGGNFSLSGGTETVPSGAFTSLSLSGGGTYALVSGVSVSENLSIASGTVASLGSGVNDTAGSLTLGGAGEANGTWGSTSSTATHTNNTYFAGTGEVTVTTNTSLKATTTTLNALAALTYGNSVTFTAVMAPAPGGGTVQFETNGVAIGNPATVSSSTATFTTSALPAGSYTITAVYSGASGYSGSTSATATQVVNPVTVSITSGLTVSSKVYNQSTTATLSSNNVVLSGVLAADAANAHLSTNNYVATFARAGAGSGIAVTVSGLTLAGGAAANYTLAQPTGLTASITVAPLTVISGIAGNNKAYDGTTTATISSNSVVLSGVQAGDTVGVATNHYSATFASASAASGVTVTVSGLTLTGSAATNYSLTQLSGLTASITALPVTVTSGVTVNSRAYNGTATATISSNNVVLSGVLSGDAANVKLSTNGYAAIFASAAPGSGIGVTISGLTLTGSAAGNYTLTQPGGLTAGITAVAVTITSGITANSKNYDGTTTATISSNSVVLSGVLAGDTASVALSTNACTATFSSAAAGSGKAVAVSGLTLTGSAAGNYTLAQPAGLTAGITAIPVAITSGITANSKVYNGTNTATISSNNVVLSGVVAGDTASVKLSTNGYSASFASASVASGAAVAVSGLTLTGSAAGNYTLAQPAGLTANITPATVTITSGVTARSQVYNGTTATSIVASNTVLSGVLAADTANVHLSVDGATATFASAGVGAGIGVTVSGATLTGSAAGNYTLTQPTGLTAGITAAPVTITSGVTANNKTYNGTTAATLSANSAVLSGVVAGDAANVTLSTSGYTATFASASVANGVAVTVGGLTLTGSAAGNYTLAQPTGLAANITPATVTITSGVTANNKGYNGTTSATISLGTVVLSGVVSADTANVKLATNGYTANFASASVAGGVAVTVGGLTLTGSAAGNYTLTQPAGLTANITAMTVTITSGVTVNNKTYDGTTTATISANSVVLSGVLAGDAANVALSTNGYTATFASASAHTGTAVTVGGLTLTGSAAGDYTLTQPAGLTANITPVTATITSGITANDKIYNATNTATISSNNVALSGVLAGDAASVKLATNGYAATFASAGVSNGIAVTVGGLTLTGSAAGNYTLTQPAGLTASIAAATVTIASGLAAGGKVYDGTTTATLGSNNVVLSGIVTGDAANVKLSTNGYTATFASATVANGIAVTVSGLTLTGSAAGNYTLTQPAGLTASITPMPVTITSGVAANDKVYNGTPAAAISTGSVVLSGVLDSDSANVQLSASGYTATFASAGVAGGIAVNVSGLALTGSAAGNYTLTQPTGLTASITPAPVTITSGVAANNKAYNGTASATLSLSTVVLSGVVTGDAANVHLSTNGYTASFASAGAGNGIAVTVSGLTLTGSAAGNYALTQPAGLTANITGVAVTISGITANSKVYDGTTTATISSNNVVLSGLAAGDAANVQLSTNGYTAVFASASVAGGKAVTVSGLTLTGSAAGNYTLTQPTGLTAGITGVPVTITSGVTADDKVYSGTTTATISSNNVVLGGVLAGDTANVHLSTNGCTAAFASAGVADGVAVTVGGLTLTGSAAGNYTLTQPAGLTASITPVTVTITSGVTANSKAYDGTTVAMISSNNVVLHGVLAGDTANVRLSTNGYTATFASGAVANGITVTAGGLTLTGSAAGNYTLTQPAGLTANITTVPVTILSGVTANNKVYDGTTAATISSNNVVLSGVLPGDAANVALSTNGCTATFASAALGTGIGVTVHGLTLTGSAAASYTLAQPAGLTANITQVTVAITSPTAGQQFVTNSGTLTAAGTTSGNGAVAGVWLSADGVTWTAGTTANGWTNWSAAVPVAAGAQVLQAYAVDTAGNYSHTNTVAFTIIHTGTLTVLTTGTGAVSPNYNGQTLKIGTAYNMVASANNGWAFANWTSSLLTTNNTASLNFTMTSNLVLTANFRYTIPPLLSVLALTNKQVVVTNSTTVTVQGKASSIVPLTDVLLSIDGGAWTEATSTNGWTNWVGVLPVTTGAQVLQAYAMDAYGNHSLTNTINFTIAHTGYMTVLTNGNGTVSPNYNNTYLQIGGVYTMQATGRNGWTFTNWTSNFPQPGTFLTNNDHVTFQMVSNLVITANYVDVSMPTITVPVLPAGQYAETNQSPLVINGATVSAADNSLVTGVFVSFNSNAWQSATTANNWTNWTTAVVPQPGTNSVRAYAVDVVGNSSYTNSFKFTYFEALPLTVQTNQFGTGLGTITLSTNGQNLIVGTKYFIKAQPLTGSVFSNWTSNLLPASTAGTLEFTMVSNLMLYANFLDVTKPTLAVSNLVKGQVVTSTPFTIQGGAADNVAVGQVMYNLNSNGWQIANGTTSWSVSASLAPGTNVFQAYALDTGNNHSTTNTISFLYAVSANLTLQTNGLGTISNPNTGGFVIGQKYSLTAVPAAGFAFTNWTSNLAPGTKSTTITFTMVSNLVLTANFVDSRTPTVAIISPVSGRFTNSPIIITGTAADNWGVGAVYCQVNGGAWMPASTANGYTNWSLTVNLAPGTNVINAIAEDLNSPNYGVARYSPTNSVVFYFLTAPYNLLNLRAMVTPNDGSAPFELDFGSNTFSQYAWSTNNYSAAGTYTYANPGLAAGVLNLNSFALPGSTYTQNLQLNFTNRYVATFSYTGSDGQTAGASAVFGPATNVATAALSGQSLESVSDVGAVQICNFLTNGQAVLINGVLRQTNNWTYQFYGPSAGLLTLTGGGQTNWTLIHYEVVHAGEYFSENSDDVVDAGLTGFVRPSATGDAPAAGTLGGTGLLVNSGDTLTSLALTDTQFSLTTSDNSLTGSGSYTYSLNNPNAGQLILDYNVPDNFGSVTSVIQFINPNFGVMNNGAAVSGVILR